MKAWKTRIFGLLAAVALYVLSTGPVFRLFGMTMHSATLPQLKLIYFPILWLCDASSTVWLAVLWYLSLWLPN